MNNNFNLSTIINCEYINSDLYISRFIGTFIENSIFEDCNLKRVNYTDYICNKVSFRLSNIEEAFFKRDHKNKAMFFGRKICQSFMLMELTYIMRSAAADRP